MSPVMYLEWLINAGKREYLAVEHVEKLYLRQTGKKIKFIQKFHKGLRVLVWDYESK